MCTSKSLPGARVTCLLITNLWSPVSQSQLHPIQEAPSCIIPLHEGSHCCQLCFLYWKDGKTNPADILSKHWEFAKAWPFIKPLLFWRGEMDETNNPAKGSDRIPTFQPSHDAATVPGSFSLTRPLAQCSHLGELTIKPGSNYSLYSWLSNEMNTGSCTYQLHTIFLYTHSTIHTQVWGALLYYTQATMCHWTALIFW